MNADADANADADVDAEIFQMATTQATLKDQAILDIKQCYLNINYVTV